MQGLFIEKTARLRIQCVRDKSEPYCGSEWHYITHSTVTMLSYTGWTTRRMIGGLTLIALLYVPLYPCVYVCHSVVYLCAIVNLSRSSVLHARLLPAALFHRRAAPSGTRTDLRPGHDIPVVRKEIALSRCSVHIAHLTSNTWFEAIMRETHMGCLLTHKYKCLAGSDPSQDSWIPLRVLSLVCYLLPLNTASST